jgi:hypothetical protein
MTERTKTVTWDQMVVVETPPAETFQARRVTRGERMYTPQPASVTLPPKPVDLDVQRLQASLAALPQGLEAEFTMQVNGKAPAMYIVKRARGVVSHWATYAIHIDPIYGEWQNRDLPRQARKWLGRTPWATVLMIAHEVPAWCMGTYPDPRRVPVNNLVSDIAGLTRATIDPILYGVVVSGRQWAFVPLAEWRL